MANNDEVWIKFLRKHWKMTILIAAGIGIAIICGLLLFLWFILPNALPNNILPKSLAFWTVGSVVNFVLNVILWEFLFIGIPVIACAALIFIQWWRKLPDEEKEEYTGEPKKKGKTRQITTGSSGGGIFSFLIFLTWLIIIYTDNQWDTFFATWSIEYFLYSWIAACLWDLLIFGVPICIVLVIWIHHEIKKES